MKLPIIYLLYFMFFNPSHPFKMEINKCRTQANTNGFCREESDCVGAKEPLLPRTCPGNYVCCPVKRVSRKKCYEYSKAVFGQESIHSLGVGHEDIVVDECGIVAVPLIVGGEKAVAKEFPHMVAIGYKKNEKSKVVWQCGGSLINEVFVLTAAHCINKQILQKYELKLGAINVNLNDKNYIQVRKIQEAILHPRWRKVGSKVNDIALIKMKEQVNFTPYVRPICLDYKGEFPQHKVLAIGHGYTDFDHQKTSDDLMKVKLDIINKTRCSKHWGYVYKDGLPDSLMCAGSAKAGKDTCQGDSGGPIQVILEKPYCMYRCLGLTFEGNPCGYKNSFNLYTRVFWFIPWIENIVSPGEN